MNHWHLNEVTGKENQLSRGCRKNAVIRSLTPSSKVGKLPSVISTYTMFGEK